jgi:threonine dehydratase
VTQTVTIDDIRDAATRVAAVVRPTPVERTDALGRVVGRPVLLKPEHRQRTGSFKIRGAYNRISRLDPATTPAVVAASAGNHAQGVALAARQTGIPATIFMPTNASLPKLQATLDYGADVELVPGTVEDAIAAARARVEETGATFVHPFDDPLIIAGQGTIGLELLVEAPEAEIVLVPVGGGGLVTGIAKAMPGTRVIGVRPVDRSHTMADGVAVTECLDLDVEIVTVGEEDISRAMLLLLERAKAVVEPAGALGLAALLAGAVPGEGPVAVVLSGGNVDPLLLTRLVEHGLGAAGRYLVLDLVLPDHPGQLAALSTTLADLNVNVLTVEHHREGVGIGLGQAEVRLTVEARDHAHGAEIAAALRQRGFALR